jgi:hypothetical protein
LLITPYPKPYTLNSYDCGIQLLPRQSSVKTINPPDAALFEKSPAMAQGVVDKMLMAKELLFWRIAKPSML